MDRNTQAQDKLVGFISRLESLGYSIKQLRAKPQIYSINGTPVNIRSRGKYKETADGNRLFWYSIAFSVLEDVKWVIYLTTGPDYCFCLPSNFLTRIKHRMYCDYAKAGVGVFDINWDSLNLELREGSMEPIESYYWDLKDPTTFPVF